jgi:hypothetical protein
MKYYKINYKDISDEINSSTSLRMNYSMFLKGMADIDTKNQIMYYARTAPFVPKAILFNPVSLIITKEVYLQIPQSPVRNYGFYNMIVDKIVRLDWIPYKNEVDELKRLQIDEIIVENKNDIELFEANKELFCLNAIAEIEYNYNGGIVKVQKDKIPHFSYAKNSPSTTFVSEEFKDWLEENNFAEWLNFVETGETIIE